jgi:2-polyprenyl-3-methyl-5-hydroxy-6-metoxy-1,4-benzoquinol methylase
MSIKIKLIIKNYLVFPIQKKALKNPLLYRILKKCYMISLNIYRIISINKIGKTTLFLSSSEGLIRKGNFGNGQMDTEVNPYSAEYENEASFEGHSADVKVVAYFLPQFHATPENDKWWGTGFTEWTNTKKALPIFPGHYQPREPHADIGYYDLSDVSALKKQAEMAKRHGINGFAFYHYWFHGNRLLGKPVDSFLVHSDIDIEFCLCWANETWSKRWDGKDHDILIKQNYSPEDDIRFIEFLAPFFRDRRYIRVNNRPLLQVYRVSKLPNPRETANRWRAWCQANGIGEIHLVAVTHAEIQPSKSHLREIGFDSYAAFTPHNFPCNHIPSEGGLFDGGYRFDYADGVKRYKSSEIQEDVYECCTMGWDNTARFGKRANIYTNYSTELYYNWLVEALNRTRKKFDNTQKILFINAWNEWAEGVYLEPDKKFGYSSLNTTSKAIFGLPLYSGQQKLLTSPEESFAIYTQTADKYTKDFEWLKYTIQSGAENSLTKINSLIKEKTEILEFGPAAGYFTRYLKEERQAIVDIIEIDEACAKRAAQFARYCFVGDLEDDAWSKAFEGRSYDYIIFADVLEHLSDPLSVLRKSATLIRPNGLIIISVPNVAHWQIIAALINNDFSYNKVGIMDHTHLRFFTEPTLRQMIYEADLKPVHIEPVNFPELPISCGTKWNKIHVPAKIKKYLRSKAYADAIQIVVSASKTDNFLS